VADVHDADPCRECLPVDQHTSWATVREMLANHNVATMVLPTDGGKVLRIRKGTPPEPEQLELYRLLNIPAEIMQPIKTWS
jgi:hypothetical protein